MSFKHCPVIKDIKYLFYDLHLLSILTVEANARNEMKDNNQLQFIFINKYWVQNTSWQSQQRSKLNHRFILK